MKLLLLLVLLVSCGKSDSKFEPCKPQEIAIDECVVKKFENWPNEYLIETYKDECKLKYPLDICYYNTKKSKR